MNKRHQINDNIITTDLNALSKKHWIIYISQLCIFIAYSLLSLKDNLPLNVELSILLGLFFIGLLLNSYHIHNNIALNNRVKKQLDVDNKVINSIVYATIFFDEKNNITAVDGAVNFSEISTAKQPLDFLLKLLKVNRNGRMKIKQAIETKGSAKTCTVFLGTYSINNTAYDLNLKFNDYKNLDAKLLYVTNHAPGSALKNTQAFEEIGYYEVDSKNKLIACNAYLSKILGYNDGEIASNAMSLNQVIDEKDVVKIYVDSNFTNLRNNWQGVVNLISKYKESITCFIAQKALHDEKGKIQKYATYVFKMHNAAVLQEKNIEQNWINYSWACFFDMSPYPIALLDNQGLITKYNNSFETNFSKFNINTSLLKLFASAEAEKIEVALNNMQKNKFAPTELKGVLSADESPKIINLLINKIYDFDGKQSGYVVRVVDVTHQQQLEDNLSHAQRMQTTGQLVGAVAHDFNNLLTAISGFCDILLQRHSMGDPSFLNIIQIKQSSDRAANLVNRLLAFSRKQTLKLEIIDLREFFSDISTLIQRLIGSDMSVQRAIDSDIWPVKFDPVQMEQVVLNLIVNARQASTGNGAVNIEIKNYKLVKNSALLKDYSMPAGELKAPYGEYVMMKFSDNGSGIPKEIIQKIFDPFFTTKSDKSGTGLGLSTVYGIVRQSEGYIYVKSEVGVGTSFLILLKKAEKKDLEHFVNSTEISINEVEKDKEDLAGRGTILLVEDEEAVRIFTKSALVSKGYDVIDFDNAKSALQQINKHISNIDLIVSDVVMPELSGPEFISEVRKIRPNIKVLFMSGYGEDAFTEEYGDKRDFNFIPKPFSLKSLVLKVKEII